MARPTNESKEIAKELKGEIDGKSSDTSQSDILKMLQGMQEQLNKIEKENETLKQENITLKSSVKNDSSDPTDDYNKLVTIKNMYDGNSLTIKIDDNGRTATLTGMGSTLKRRLIEILDIVRLNPKFARMGYFIIDDEYMVEHYFPEMIEYYKQTVDMKTLNTIGTLSIEDLKQTVSNVNYIYQKAIIDKFITEYIRGTDDNYTSLNKIQALSAVVGIDVMAMINGVMETENSKKEFVNK